MWRLIATILILGCTTPAWNQEDVPNVNSRYTVESVRVEGYRSAKVSAVLKAEMQAAVGQKLDQSMLDRISERLRKDLRVEKVSVKVSRGDTPDHVKVEFLTESRRHLDFDVDVPQFSYHSRQGWTAKGEVNTDIQGNRLSFGLVSDGDTQVERFSGLETSYRRQFGRVHLGFLFGTYHQQWNSATIEAADANPSAAAGGLYRSRQLYEPTVAFVLAEPLTLEFAVVVQPTEQQAPGAPTQYANLAAGTLRFHRQWAVGDGVQSTFDASYVLRAATRVLNSDYVFVRNSIDARYELTAGKQTFVVGFFAGGISGNAPLFERFVLGNATTLRGWNKYDLDPLGGERVVHGTLEYRWRSFQVFYDTGAIWDRQTSPDQKQSVGFGLRTSNKDGAPLVAIAFPLQNGHTDPMFIVGFNF